MTNEPRKFCIICLKEIYRSVNKRDWKMRRKITDITCSRQCSRVYTRVNTYITSRLQDYNKRKNK